MNETKNLLKKSGFSLIEILAALGIVGAISLTVGTLMQTTKKYTRGLQNFDEVENFVNQMYHQSQIQEVCAVNFPPGTTIPLATDRTYFLDANGNTLFTSGNMGTNATVSGFSFNIGYSNVAKDQVLLTITFTSGTNSDGLNNILGSKTVTRSFPLYLSYDTTTDRVIECLSMDNNYNQTIYDMTCNGTGAMGDDATQTCYHIGLDTTNDCSADKFVNGFLLSNADRKYKFYPDRCVDKTGSTYHAPCASNQLLMGFDASGNFVCTPITATQLFVGFDQTASACASSFLNLTLNSPTGPVDVACSGAAVATPTPTAATCSMAATQYPSLGSNLRLWGDGNWYLTPNMNTSATGGPYMTIVNPGAPYTPYVEHINDINATMFSNGTSGMMVYDMIYSLNFSNANPPNIPIFYIEENTSGNYNKVTYYTRAVSTQNTDPAVISSVYGTITCKYVFEKTAATTYRYTITIESCDPANGDAPTATIGPTTFTYVPGSYSINLANKFIAGLAPACGISIKGPGCSSNSPTWPTECIDASSIPDYTWTWVAASKKNDSFNSPNMWQKQLQVVGGDWNSSSSYQVQTKGVLDDFKICLDTNPSTGASASCDIP